LAARRSLECSWSREVPRFETADVVVIGLGPAGSRAAGVAAQAGLRVIALERRREAGRPVQCAEFVPALLQQEVPDLLSVSEQRVTSMATFVENEPPDEMPNFHGYMINRAAFDRLLADQAAGAGAECRFGCALLHIDAEGLVYTSDHHCLRAQIIIGADGPHSRIGAAIGQRNQELVETRQVTVPLLHAYDATDIFLSGDYPGGYGWLFPKSGFANLGLGLCSETRHQLKRLLDQLHRRLKEEGRVGSRSVGLTGGPIPVGGRLRATGFIGRVPVVLAGDAAGLTNPITGAGIAAAVQSGGLAGRAAIEWLAGRSDALDLYEEELADIFDASLHRALRHRRTLMARCQGGSRPSPDELRSAWIAYPQYWSDSCAGS